MGQNTKNQEKEYRMPVSVFDAVDKKEEGLSGEKSEKKADVENDELKVKTERWIEKDFMIPIHLLF